MRVPRPAPSRRRLRALARAEGGVAALEFAMIAPVMILMFFGMAELGQGLIAARRVTHACSALGDLVAQDDNLHDSEVTNVFAAAADILAPMPTAKLNMRVTSITADKNGHPLVDWSEGYGAWSGDPKGVAPPQTLPTGLVSNPGDTIILAEAGYTYTSPIGYVLPNGMSFQRAAYLRPRQGSVQRTSP